MSHSSRRTQLGVHCVGDIVPRDVLSDATRKNQNWWLPFTTKIVSSVLVSFFTSSGELPIYILTCNKHVKFPLVVYATVKMHEIDRVLRQLGFQQSILVAPQDLDDLYPIDLQGPDENCLVFHSQHINMWNNRLMSGWTVGHPSQMFYMSEPSHSPMTLMLTMMYRPFMYQALMESPLVIPSVYGTQHSYAHLPFVMQIPLGSLFYQGEEEEQSRPQLRPEAEPRRNPARKLRQPQCCIDSVRHMH
ncbi:hypothetical protein PVK06_026856 [Gossypium arboreum]|uniref:Uncharacterized protein n=1 Tax=Gossypium arboreum TaxID=29729 RepID=A0ABR0NZ37_GOSAR|nr:hypothetical protein PVK06_026856 [Gossypium arboreum]